MSDGYAEQAIYDVLARIADALERIAANTSPEEPDHRRPLEEYANFDYSTIGAAIAGRDSDGPVALIWNGHSFTRRSAAGKFGQSIWFSRAAGNDEGGNTRFIRLITFKNYAQAEPVPFTPPGAGSNPHRQPAPKTARQPPRSTAPSQPEEYESPRGNAGRTFNGSSQVPAAYAAHLTFTGGDPVPEDRQIAYAEYCRKRGQENVDPTEFYSWYNAANFSRQY